MHGFNKKIGSVKTNIIHLGDSAYPLLPFLLTPKLNEEEGTPGARYTDHHVRTRVAIECCFGILKGHWRWKERALHYRPQFAGLYTLSFLLNLCNRRLFS